jgi:hypothetical protein
VNPRVVAIDAREREARGAPAALPVGAFLELADGQVVRVGERGELEQLVRGGAPWGRSLASDPCARRGG